MLPQIKRTLFATLAVAAFASLTGPVKADEAKGPFTLTGSVNFASDYIYRGFTQTSGGPAIQGSIGISHESGLYVGAWGSNLNFNDGSGADLELDLYGGYTGEFQGFTYDVGFLYYWYPGVANALGYNFWEVYGKVGYDLGVASLSAGLSYSPDFFGNGGDATNISGGVEVPVPLGEKDFDLSVSGHVGYQFLQASYGADYTYWDLGATVTVFGLSIDGRYYDADVAPARGVVSVGVSF